MQPIRDVFAGPDDLHCGATVLYDPQSKELMLRAWYDEAEIAFRRISVDAFVKALGLDRYIESRIAVGLAERLEREATTLSRKADELKKEGAALICPFSVGNVIELESKRGTFEVSDVYLRNSTWRMSALKLGEIQAKYIEVAEFDKPRLVKAK